MTRTSKRRQRLAATLTGAILVAAAGCGGHHHKVALPTSTTRPRATPGRVAVRDAYLGYWKAVPRAEHASSARQRRRVLAPYTADPQLSTVLRNIRELHAHHRRSWGHIIVHIQRQKLDHDVATVWDCQDSRHAGLADSRSGRKLDHGVAGDKVRASLSRGGDHHWRIKHLVALGRC